MGAREVDFGWWGEKDGRQARLTWAAVGRRLFMFHVAGHTETLTAGVTEAEALVGSLTSVAGTSSTPTRCATPLSLGGRSSDEAAVVGRVSRR